MRFSAPTGILRTDRIDIRSLVRTSSRHRHLGHTNLCIISPVKDVAFVGGSGDDLRAFPAVARQRAGYQLYRVQAGREPADW